MNKYEIEEKLKSFGNTEPEKDEIAYLSEPDKSDLISWENAKKEVNDKIEKFILRLPGSLGAKLREEASNEGVSLNQYILLATAFYEGYKKGLSESK